MVFGSNLYGVILAACGLGLVWLSVPTVLSLHQSWVDFNYSHGYLIAFIVGGLLCRELKRAPLAPPNPSAWGVAALCFCVLGTLLGHAADALIVTQFLFPLLLLSTLWAVTGWQDANRFWWVSRKTCAMLKRSVSSGIVRPKSVFMNAETSAVGNCSNADSINTLMQYLSEKMPRKFRWLSTTGAPEIRCFSR